jgi:hypothetical protein
MDWFFSFKFFILTCDFFYIKYVNKFVDNLPPKKKRDFSVNEVACVGRLTTLLFPVFIFVVHPLCPFILVSFVFGFFWMEITHLPRDILILVGGYLKRNEVLSLSLLCHSLHKIGNEDTLWYVFLIL